MKAMNWLQGLPLIRAFAGGGGLRLVRGYFLIFVLVISGGLITSGLVEIYFRYFENLEQIGLLQREVALGASFKIEQFVQEIERTIRGVTKSREIVVRGLTPKYKFELRKLLLIAPPITEAVAIDDAGVARTQVSRLRTILPGDRRDLKDSAAFKRARQGKSYFGPVYFVRGSEPYMTIAVPIERYAGEVIGVLQAEVNLKYIWEVISGIQVGTAGYAYVVSRSGDLIAHPKISLVLQRQKLSRLGQVKAAFSGSGPRSAATSGTIGENLEGEKVFSSHSLVPGLNWAVIIEQPVAEAYKKLYASLFRTSGLLLLGIGSALLASLFIARRVVRPLRVLRQGVERIGGGDLDFRLDIKTGDEIEVLADEFNKMSSALQEAYSGLEQKVEERTQELTEALEQQTATSEILGVISGSPTDLQPVFDAVLESATQLCDAHMGILGLYDGERYRHVAQRGASPEFQQWLFRGPHRFDPSTGIGRMVREQRPIHVPDLTEEPAYKNRVAARVATVELGGARTFLAVPMIKEGRVVGGIVIYRPEVRPFTDKQIELVTTFADQAVIAIENVRLFQEIQEKNRQLDEASQHKSEFLANMSHELRTPLNSIMGFTRLVLRRSGEQLPEVQQENLKKVLVSSDHLLNLINDLLDLSKIEAGRMEIFAEDFDVAEVLLPAASTVEPMLRSDQVELVRDIKPGIPTLHSDKEKLRQIVLNLLSNAVKFTEEGEVRISALSDNGMLNISVSDTGIGINQESVEKVFEDFQQADMSSTRKYGGTGLGLAIVKRLAILLGGDVGVSSEPGKGTKFTLSIPVICPVESHLNP